MHATGGGYNGSGLEDRLRLIIVDSPDVAAPLVGALDVADIGAWMWVADERALYFSPGMFELLGLAREPRGDLLRRFVRSVHADDQGQIRGLLNGQMPGGRFRLRYRVTPPAGPLRWIEDRGRVERDATGALIRQGGAMRDVTHEVGAEQERREADARLEALVNAIPFPVWGRSGPNLVVTHQNAASIASWGNLRGQQLEDAPAELRPVWEQQLADAMTGQIVRARREEMFADEPRTVDEIVAPVIVEDAVTGVVGVAIDVSEEARAGRVQALLLEISADFAGRSTDTLDTGIVQALERVARFLGAPVAVLGEIGDGQDDDQLRITHSWFDPATQREQPRVLEVDISALRSLLRRIELNAPLIVRSRDELAEGSCERAWLTSNQLQSLALVPTRALDGRRTLLGLAGASDDIVEWPPDTASCMRLVSMLLGGVLTRARVDDDRKVVERGVQEAHKVESLGVLAGGVAHHFNNLLTAILGNASLLRQELPDTPGVSDALDQIDTASRRAADLCREMLAYSGRGRLALHVTDLNALLREMRPFVEVTVPKTARLVLDFAPRLPGVRVDQAQLRQLVLNLVLNAAESLQNAVGTITIRTTSGPRSAQDLAKSVFGPQLPGGTYVSLSVSDNGCGMTADTVERIFDPFFSTKFTGRGLGLAAVVGIVRAHSGALNVVTESGEGSTFELLLPADAARPADAAEPLLPFSHDSLLKWRTTGTALVVDDERGVRELVRTVLQRVGMTVVVADSGGSGVEAFNRAADDIRVVLLDLRMPGLDGRRALEAIRRTRPDVPAILMSGYAAVEIESAAAFVFLPKPFTPAVLRAAVKRALNE